MKNRVSIIHSPLSSKEMANDENRKLHFPLSTLHFPQNQLKTGRKLNEKKDNH